MDAIINSITDIIKWMGEHKEAIAMIIDTLGMLATVAAVIVAIIANRNASESLQYSLKMQEQSKNIDLFDKRIALIDEIRTSNKVSVLHLELLFNKEIAQEYGTFRVYLNDAMNAHHDMSVYDDIMSTMDGADLYTSPIAELQDAEQTLDKLNYPADKVEEYKALCLKYQITHSETGELADAKVYNFEDLSEQISSTELKAKEQKNKVMGMMKKYIECSISPVDKKVRATK